MLFTDALLFTEGSFRRGAFRVENGRFKVIFTDNACPSPFPGEPVTDLHGQIVLPGLVDIHTHGNSGADFSDGDPAGLDRMASYLAENGVTSFAPASMTLPYDMLEAAFANARDLRNHPKDGRARLQGIHMEGPFFSEKKKGAQRADWLKAPDISAFLRLNEACSGLIRIVDLAPELPGAVEFVREAKKYCTVSAAHTDASYEEAAAFFDAGASHLTHLYNGMPSIHHRTPGVIGAASERSSVIAELICDGIHVHPSAVRMAFRLFPGRICLISDAFRGCGMPDGDYSLGGQAVTLRDHRAVLSDGTIAGSAENLFTCMRRAVSFGIPAEQAILSATLIPAREIHAEDTIGSIAPGRYADFVICDGDLTRRAVYMNGKRI